MSETTPEPSSNGMNRHRRWALSAFFLFVIGGHAFDVVAKRDDWPFSRYPMYAVVRPSVVERDEVVGVGQEGEFELRVPHHLAPFDVTRLRWVLSKIEKKRASRYSEALDKLFARYEHLREAGRHSGPPILAIRTYRTTWTIESRAHNRQTPDQRVLKFYAQRIPPSLRDDLDRQRNGEAQPLQTIDASDVVINAADFTLTEGAELKERATAGDVLLLRARKGKDKQNPLGAEVTIRVAPGRYYLWLRGRSGKKPTQDTLGVRAIHGGDITCWSDSIGLGNWHQRFDADTFAWSGTAPGAPPCVLNTKHDAVTLQVWAREGHVLLDQLWLSRNQAQPPAFARAVVGSRK